MNKKNNYISLLAIIISITAITIAFSAISSTLTIRGSATLSPAFSVKFMDLEDAVLEGDASVSHNPIINSTSITNIHTIFVKNNGAISYKFKAKNNGSLNAKVALVNKTTPSCLGKLPNKNSDEILVCSNISYTLKYADNNEDVKVGDILNANSNREIILKIIYGGTTMPTNNVEVSNITATILYES